MIDNTIFLPGHIIPKSAFGVKQMRTLNQLKTEYLKALKKLEAETAAAEQAEAQQRQQQLDELLPRVIDYLAHREDVDPTELIQFGRIQGDWLHAGLYYVVFFLELPDHFPVRIRLNAKREEGIYNDTGWVINKYDEYTQLDAALIRAEKLHQQQQLEEQKQIKEEAERQRRDEEKKAEADRHNSAKQRIFNKVAQDPAALLLLRTFIEIQQDREAFNEQIESLEESYVNAEYWHEEALASAHRKTEQAQREAKEADSQKQSLQYEVYDLEDKLQKAERNKSRW